MNNERPLTQTNIPPGDVDTQVDEQKDEPARHGHRAMLIGCLLVLVVAIALTASGVLATAFVLPAIMCTAMMIWMMRMM